MLFWENNQLWFGNSNAASWLHSFDDYFPPTAISKSIDYAQDIFVQNNFCFWSLDTRFVK